MWNLSELKALARPYYLPLPDGGWYLTFHEGYACIQAPEHPLARKDGNFLLHRHILSVVLQRWLQPDEMVLFEDGNIGNLDPANLKIVDRKTMLRAVYPNAARVSTICARAKCKKEYLAKPSALARRKKHYCSPECASLDSRKFDPPREELAQMVAQFPLTYVGRHYGVSDKAVARRCKKLDIQLPGRGSWTGRE